MSSQNSSSGLENPGPYGPPPPPAAAGPAPSGIAAWLQFLWLSIFPVIGHIGWIIGSIVVYTRRRRDGGVGAENARNALNWCVTVCAVQLLLLGLAVLSFGFAVGWSDGTAAGDHPLIIVYIALLITLALSGVVILVVGIVGAVRAGSRRVFHPYAIPFVRTGEGKAGRRGVGMR